MRSRIATIFRRKRANTSNQAKSDTADANSAKVMNDEDDEVVTMQQGQKLFEVPWDKEGDLPLDMEDGRARVLSGISRKSIEFIVPEEEQNPYEDADEEEQNPYEDADPAPMVQPENQYENTRAAPPPLPLKEREKPPPRPARPSEVSSDEGPPLPPKRGSASSAVKDRLEGSKNAGGTTSKGPSEGNASTPGLGGSP